MEWIFYFLFGGSMKPFIVFYIKITLIIFDFKMIQLSVGQVNAVKLTFTAIHFKIKTEQKIAPINICKMLVNYFSKSNISFISTINPIHCCTFLHRQLLPLLQ